VGLILIVFFFLKHATSSLPCVVINNIRLSRLSVIIFQARLNWYLVHHSINFICCGAASATNPPKLCLICIRW